MFKKSILAIVLMTLILTSKVEAKEAMKSINDISIDNKIVQVTSYNIDGYNYFKLRDMAKALANTNAKFHVDFNEEEFTVQIIKGANYTDTADNNPIIDNNPQAQESNQDIFINGTKANIKSYLINGNNYFKLRDLGSSLNFFVDYDEASKQIILNTNKEASKTKNSEKTANLEDGFYTFNSKGGSINLPRGILISLLNDRINEVKIVEGKTAIPKDGFSIFQKTPNLDEDKKIYSKGLPLTILLTRPISVEGADVDIRASEIMGFSFSVKKEKFIEYSIEPSQLSQLYYDKKLTIYQGSTKMILDQVTKGNFVSDLYWLYSEHKDFEDQKEIMIASAISLLGTPYEYLDCSGLVYNSMAIAGMDVAPFLYTWTIDGFDNFEIVPMSELKRGDILSKTSNNGGHMMIYLGDGKVIESLPKDGVVIKNVRKQGYKVYRIKETPSYTYDNV